MTVLATAKKTEISCPDCNKDALYKYGKTRNGKQRFLCLMCGRQFSPGTTKTEVKGKPECPKCGKQMHLYKIEGDIVRFRCSNYPECKTFKKYRIQEEGNGILHS
jgi:transposase-like protein